MNVSLPEGLFTAGLWKRPYQLHHPGLLFAYGAAVGGVAIGCEMEGGWVAIGCEI
jgi:hypothetical protein